MSIKDLVLAAQLVENNRVKNRRGYLEDANNQALEDLDEVIREIIYEQNPDYEIVEKVYDLDNDQGSTVFREISTGLTYSVTPYDISSWAEGALGEGYSLSEVKKVGERTIGVYDHKELISYGY